MKLGEFEQQLLQDIGAVIPGVIGAVSLGQCPANIHINIALMSYGGFSLVLALLKYFLKVKTTPEEGENETNRNIANFVQIFLFASVIYGCAVTWPNVGKYTDEQCTGFVFWTGFITCTIFVSIATLMIGYMAYTGTFGKKGAAASNQDMA